MCRRVAPSARRMPISVRRSSTEITQHVGDPDAADEQGDAAEAEQ